jgi:hypothetical protein
MIKLQITIKQRIFILNCILGLQFVTKIIFSYATSITTKAITDFNNKFSLVFY